VPFRTAPSNTHQPGPRQETDKREVASRTRAARCLAARHHHPRLHAVADDHGQQPAAVRLCRLRPAAASASAAAAASATLTIRTSGIAELAATANALQAANVFRFFFTMEHVSCRTSQPLRIRAASPAEDDARTNRVIHGRRLEHSAPSRAPFLLQHRIGVILELAHMALS
jgi:hypothetical protein